MREAQKLAYDVAFGTMRWQTAMDRLYAQYVATGDLDRAKTILEAMTLEHPENPIYFDAAANICGKLDDLPQAAFYFSRAFRLDTSLERARTLFVLYLGLDLPDEAIPFLDYAVKSTPDHQVAMVRLYTEQVIRAERAGSMQSLDKVSTDSTVASLYITMGNQTGARVTRQKNIAKGIPEIRMPLPGCVA